MAKTFEWIGGVMFFVALLDFVPNPRKALESMHETLTAASPRIVGGHLVLPRPQKNKERSNTKGR